MPFFAPGDAYDNAVGQQAAGRLGPCSTLLGLSSNEDAAVHALLGLASGVNVSAAIPPGGVSAAQGPAPVAAAGSQHSALRETDATKMKRIYNGIYPGKKTGFPPTQSVKYVPLQVNRFDQSILLIFHYRYLNSGDFYSPESDPPHKTMHYWFYYSIWLGFSFPESVRRK